MSQEIKTVRDAFAFSLGGMGIICPALAMPAIADDRIDKIRDRRADSARAARLDESTGDCLCHQPT